jgi:hypothetical protein
VLLNDVAAIKPVSMRNSFLLKGIPEIYNGAKQKIRNSFLAE